MIWPATQSLACPIQYIVRAIIARGLLLSAKAQPRLTIIDCIRREGLGLRWSIMGPFETADRNVRGGMMEHAKQKRSASRARSHADGSHANEVPCHDCRGVQFFQNDRQRRRGLNSREAALGREGVSVSPYAMPTRSVPAGRPRCLRSPYARERIRQQAAP